jgi:hypothetical protein
VNWQNDSGAGQSVAGTNGDVQTVAVTLSPSLPAGPRLFLQIRAD